MTHPHIVTFSYHGHSHTHHCHRHSPCSHLGTNSYRAKSALNLPWSVIKDAEGPLKAASVSSDAQNIVEYWRCSDTLLDHSTIFHEALHYNSRLNHRPTCVCFHTHACWFRSLHLGTSTPFPTPSPSFHNTIEPPSTTRAQLGPWGPHWSFQATLPSLQVPWRPQIAPRPSCRCTRRPQTCRPRYLRRLLIVRIWG